MKASVEIVLKPSYISQGYINIGKKWWDLCPSVTMDVELEAEPMGIIHSQFYVEVKGSHRGFSKNLIPWFRENNLEAGDKIGITPINMKKYGLEIVR